MMTDRIWVLGAPDPEMEMIERLLRECGETVVYAADARGERVTAGAAYRGESLVTDVGNHPCTSGVTDVYLVECELLTPDAHFEPGEDICHPELAGRTVRRIDHHRPGDPGYGRPPAEFLAASSIGQVIAELARLGRLPQWPPARTAPGDGAGAYVLHAWAPDPALWDEDLGEWRGGDTPPPSWAVSVQSDDIRAAIYRLIPQSYICAAAADHCLAAAYRGECPGVDPDALMRWRAESRARFQRRAVEDVLADVERARAALREAPVVSLAEGIHARDLRGPSIPELPEAAAREGECFLASLRERDGKTKVVCQSGTPEQIEAFMRVWAPARGLVDIYGDPERGFAGGYMPEIE